MGDLSPPWLFVMTLSSASACLVEKGGKKKCVSAEKEGNRCGRESIRDKDPAACHQALLD